MKPRKVMIIGAGNVGSAAAHAFVNQNICEELVLVDLNKERVEGHRKDLADAAAFTHGMMKIGVREAKDCKDIDIAVITVTAGALKEGQTRLDELKSTSRIIANIVPDMMKNGFEGIFLVAANPVDIITYQVWKLSGLPRHRVLGTGVWLDTTRLRRLLSEKLDVAPQSIDAFVLGEHGDSQFPVWSHSSVYGKSINAYSKQKFGTEFDLKAIGERARDTGFEIYHQKGCTEYGIAGTIVEISRNIFSGSHRALAVSCVLEGEYGKSGIAIGVPAVLAQDGVKEIIELELNELEKSQFDASAAVIAENIGHLG
ncbi:L-lactate dehydrogenase [Listeria booriae]|uniref:L-lactate dehydrogenase n=1 Tax=Listeria booriae TaxID=1552123 RepID=UPI001625D400|nr:L-lactate dehydrogenase [Listeria booriae]MBC2317585.1 L-lactate dehydrogenase [Listeria booriae]